MLKGQDEPLGLLGNPGSEGSVGNAPALGLSANVEDDGAGRGLVVVVEHKVPLQPGVGVLIVVMVDDLGEPVLLLLQGVGFGALEHLSSLDLPAAS